MGGLLRREGKGTGELLMTNATDSAFIFNPEFLNQDNPLTKREYFAAMAMQGLLANPRYTDNEKNETWYHDVKIDAVTQADELIKELNK